MTRSKITDSEKLKILDLYRQPRETTSSLAEQYGVSSSTIRRILKDRLSNQEYEILANQKQAGRSTPPESLSPQPKSKPDLSLKLADQQREQPLEAAVTPAVQPAPVEVPDKPKQRSRQRLTVKDKTARPDTLSNDSAPIPAKPSPGTQLELQPQSVSGPESQPADNSVLFADAELEALDDELTDLADQDDALDDLDDQDDELEDDFDEEDDLDDLEEDSFTGSRIRSEAIVATLPLAEASMPRTCYLVIDRAAELITRPLNEFADLGILPPEEVQEKTLPVFDNHRVARRFSNRMQRVVKLPNGDLLQKTSSQLSAKGITRLLINGQVYSL